MSARANERLRIAIHKDGTRQVVDCEDREKAETKKARKVMDFLCPRCRQCIKREPYHIVVGQLNGEQLYHVGCTVI